MGFYIRPKVQNVWTKEWTTTEEDAKIESRKIVGLQVNGVTIRQCSDYVIQRMAERSVLPESILDAVQQPLDIKTVKYDRFGKPSFVVVGCKATLAINPETGVITTTYPTHTGTREKLLKKKGLKR